MRGENWKICQGIIYMIEPGEGKKEEKESFEEMERGE